ncbi:MAG TPA: hypothetical protein VFG78_10625 [Gemmatimonadota bacterium]|nr:hypothetical protein [Gemmatimonadota bacterium]
MRSMTCRVLLALAIAACSSSGYGPDDPGDGDELDVSGTWTVTATLIEEDCPEDVEEVNTGTIQIEQNGTQITFRQGSIVARGSINLQTGEFMISGMIEAIDGLILIMEEGRFTSDARYTSESSFTFQPTVGPSCTILTSDSGVRQ